VIALGERGHNAGDVAEPAARWIESNVFRHAVASAELSPMRTVVWVGAVAFIAAVVAALAARNEHSMAAEKTVLSISAGPRHSIRAVTDEDGRLVAWSESTLEADGRWWADGVRLRFYGDGSLRMEDHFVHGERDGTCRTYDPAGHVIDEREFLHTQPVDLEKHYDAAGDLTLVRRFANGVEACAPLVRRDGDPPIRAAEIACWITEPVNQR